MRFLLIASLKPKVNKVNDIEKVRLFATMLDEITARCEDGKLRLYGRVGGEQKIRSWCSVGFRRAPASKWELIPQQYWISHRLDLLRCLEEGRLGTCQGNGQSHFLDVGIGIFGYLICRFMRTDPLPRMTRKIRAAAMVTNAIYWRSFWMDWHARMRWAQAEGKVRKVDEVKHFSWASEKSGIVEKRE